jgi:hypothetical protein
VPVVKSIYVDPAEGDDANSGSAEAPFQTIQKALDLAQPGWHIKLRSGTYEQNAQTVTPGRPGLPIVIEPDGNAQPVLDGDLDINAPEILDSHYLIRGLEIRNFDQGIRLEGVQGVTLEGNHIHHMNGECVRLRYFSVQNVVRGNNIHDCGLERNGEGIYVGTAKDQLWKNNDRIDESQGNLIEGNEIYDVEEGIDIKEGSSHTTITRNEIYRAENESSGGINIRSDENYITSNSAHHNEGAGLRIGTEDEGVNNLLRSNVASYNEFVGYKFINGPQDADCSNTGTENDDGRLYYFMDGIAEFLQCEGERFPAGEPWEAEYGEVVGPLKVGRDPSASSGKHLLQLDEGGAGYVVYQVVVPRDGEYQLKASVKTEAGKPSPAKVSFDGKQPPRLWRLGEVQGEWSWVFGPSVQLSAGVHELRIFLEGPTTYIDKLELRSR